MAELMQQRAFDLIRAPYILNFFSGTGGVDMGAGPTAGRLFFGAPGLPDGIPFLVKKHEVRKTVLFSPTNSPTVWGRGVGTSGWYDDGASINYGLGWCEVVPGSVTTSSATLRTYVFEVYTYPGQFVGWYPASPSNVTFAYTVHGTPGPMSVTISGPSCVGSKGASATLTALATGGDGMNYSYYWTPGGYTTQSITRPIFSCPVTYHVTVSSGGQQATASRSIYYAGGSCGCGGGGGGGCDQFIARDGAQTQALPCFAKSKGREDLIPDKFDLLQNYPNPFNPSTSISFALPEGGHVALKIYNLQGQLVRTLVDRYLGAGYYDATFDGLNDRGSELSSGVYVYRLESGRFMQSMKLTLVK